MITYKNSKININYSQNLTSEHLQDFASIADIECVTIDKDTKLHQLRNELRWSEVAYK